MGAGTIIFAFAALLFLTGGFIMSAALDRLTNSVNAAVSALNEASTATPATDDAALTALADNLDAAVNAYHAAITPPAA